MYEHKELAVAFHVLNFGEPVMLRDRTWKERFLSWPWRPWITKTATPLAIMMKLRKRAHEDMRKITGTNIF
jgi:hypothetical protein